MARPEEIEDLDSYMTAPRTVASFETRDVTKARSISLIKAMYDFAVEAEKLGFTVDDDYNGMTIKKPLTEKELDDALTSEQRSWDRRQECYLEALLNPALWLENNKNTKWLVDHHASKEGRDPIDWEAGAVSHPNPEAETLINEFTE